MAAPRLTEAQLDKTAATYRKHKGDRNAAAAELGLTLASFTSRIRLIKSQRGKDYFADVPLQKPTRPGVPDEEITRCWRVYASNGYIAEVAARELGIPRSTLTSRLQIAERMGYVVPSLGTEDARKPVLKDLPAPGQIKRYLLTSAQNNTRLHTPTWKALHALANHYDAEIMISRFMYIHSQEGSAKMGTGKRMSQDEAWYTPEIESHVSDEYIQLAPGLVWCGHVNISPTAEDPLSGLDSYSGRASSIFPHVKCAMKSVPTIKRDKAKFMWTTGAVTLRNYIQRKAGLKGEFHHVYGALLAEVDSDGHWWVRQVSSDRRGWMYDLDVVAKPDGSVTRHVTETRGVAAVGFGDIHEDEIDPIVRELAWGPGGLVDTLKPRDQLIHDVLDFGRRSHHNRRSRHKRFQYFVEGRESVYDEIAGVANFLNEAARPWSRIVVVRSNHDEHLERWLNETDWHEDMVNAEFHLELQSATLKAIRERRDFNALEWVCRKKFGVKGVLWLKGDDSHIVCKDASGGIDMGMHGDKGSHGARASLKQFARLGRKVVIFHSHHCGIYGPAWQGGTSSKLDLDYNKGPSAWSHTHVVVHRNGKRQMVTMYAGKWRA
jgi:hypothetical protein